MSLRAVVALLIAILLAACGKEPDDRMGNGAAIGAGSGAAIGALFFGVGAIPGALIGASVGAGTGATTSPAPATYTDRAPAIGAPAPGDPSPTPEPAIAEPEQPVERAPLRIARLDPGPAPIKPAAPAPAPIVAAPEPPRQPAQPIYTVDDVRLVQETLQEQGLYLGPLDGTLGPDTQRALAQYQRRAGLRETAQLDPETMRRLDLEPSGPASYGATGAGDRRAAGTGDTTRP